MNKAGAGDQAAKPWTPQRIALWGLCGLIGLSVIGTALSPDPPAPAPTASTDPNAASAGAVDDLQSAMKPIGGQGQIFAFAIPAKARPIDVEAAALARCADLQFCQVYGWQDAAQMPGAWPMLDREVAALSFRYAINRGGGYEDTTWSCGSIGAKPNCAKAAKK